MKLDKNNHKDIDKKGTVAGNVGFLAAIGAAVFAVCKALSKNNNRGQNNNN